ncbi:hypothetical protein DSL72_000826 [Monilinia vaccinii-corymbosi]|uniref:Uncharacterized protein n=1 Tax=Monilinia vaccinii-corymbosi TaxID=61207 RepID=A0A8A3P0F1_9HELO|nr:hypothetical protein DSL72_000826 [Monilinia vaccinii-corymbosi]
MPPPYIGAEVPIGSTTVPLGGVIGIAIGGAIVLIVVGVTITYIRRNHRNVIGLRSNEVKDNKVISLAARTNSLSYSIPLFATPYHYLPPRHAPRRRATVARRGFIDEDEDEEDDNIVRPGTKRSSGQKGLFQRQRSGIRESWPLAARVQMPTTSLPHVQSERNIRINCVAPPGYVLSQPQRPKRAFSRKTHVKNSDSVEDITIVDGEPRINHGRRRSNSENHLTSILKSTSQRLRDTQRQTVSRNWNNLGKFPGSPPKQRLPSPPRNRATESREVLIASGCSTPDQYSLQETQSPCTPSPGKRVPRTAGRAFNKRGRSPTPSGGSDDSLCGIDIPDLFIPSQLTSPSKSGRRYEQRHQMSLSPTKGSEGAPKTNHSSKKSLTNDPFFSSVKSAKVMPSATIYGPQPRHMRKATFGQEEALEKANQLGDLPLKDISGNQLGPLVREPRSPPQSSELNPFQWSPKGAMKPRTISASPNKIISKRKGHKRSNVVRISGLTRPTSVSVVHEESEGESPGITTISRPTLRVVEPSPSCTSLASRQSSVLMPRPPSVSTFNPNIRISSLTPALRQAPVKHEVSTTPPPLKINPTFKIPPLKPVERNASLEPEEYSPTPSSSKANLIFSIPELKPIERHVSDSSNPDQYSPPLSVCNYYAENMNSDVEFFKHARSSRAMKSQVRRHCQNIDEEIISPDTPTENLVSFPPLPSPESGIRVVDPSDESDLPEYLKLGRPVSRIGNPPSLARFPHINTTNIRAPSPKRVSFTNTPNARPTSPARPSQLFTRAVNNALVLGPRPPPFSNAASPLIIPSASLPAPPLLSTPLPIPVHLTGPRPEPRKSTSYSPAMTHTSNSPRNSIATSIGLLRRMNSDISCISTGGTDSPPLVSGIGLDWGDRRHPNRASRFYLAIGSPIESAAVPSRLSSLSMLYPNTYSTYFSSYFPQFNDSSTSVNSIGERRQPRSDLMNPNYGNLQDILEDISASQEGSQGGSTRGSSPAAMGRHGLDVKEKKLSLTNLTLLPDGGIGYMMDYQDEDDAFIEPLSLSKTNVNAEKETKANDEVKEVRWSDAMIKPLVKTTRRESKMEHPTPKMLAKWAWGPAVNAARERLSRSPTRDKENEVDHDWVKGSGSPESVEFYDQEGFLKNSPGRTNADEEMRGRGSSATVHGLSVGVGVMEEDGRETLSTHVVI